MTNLQAAHTLRQIANALDPPGFSKPDWSPHTIQMYLDCVNEQSDLKVHVPPLEWITPEKQLDERTKALLGELP